MHNFRDCLSNEPAYLSPRMETPGPGQGHRVCVLHPHDYQVGYISCGGEPSLLDKKQKRPNLPYPSSPDTGHQEALQLQRASHIGDGLGCVGVAVLGGSCFERQR